MSDRPEAVLFGRGEDREPVAAMTVEVLAVHGLSPINPALGLVRGFDNHGDERLLPDAAATVAALLESRINAIRVAATGARVVVEEGVVADIGVAT